jgi:hypothetical protein
LVWDSVCWDSSRKTKKWDAREGGKERWEHVRNFRIEAIGELFLYVQLMLVVKLLLEAA